MANLIITVISIALVAVAALMGAYYGGSAFMDGQAKANANSIANAFEQVNAALQLYNLNAGNTYNPPTYGDPLSILVPAYLSAMPAPLDKNITLYNAGGNIKSIFVIRIDANKAVCEQLEKLRTGTVPALFNEYSLGFAVVIAGKIGCFHDDVGVWSSDYIAYYTPYGPI